MQFTTTINDVLKNNKISVGSKTLYTTLNMFCYGEKTSCFPSQSKLADMLGKSIRTIQRYLKELVDAGYISIQNRGHLSNIYTILNKVILNPAAAKAKETAVKLKNKFSKKKSNFNNYDQRQYDFDELERKLLGWD